MMDALVLLGSLAIFIAIGVPVAYSLGLAALVGAMWIELPLEAVMIQLGDGVNKFSLLAIPFFVLAGAIMAEGGIARAPGRLRLALRRLHPRRPVAGEHPGLDLLRRHLRFVGGRHRLDRLGDDPADGKQGLSARLRRRRDGQRFGAGDPDPAQPQRGDLFARRRRHGVDRAACSWPAWSPACCSG
jgi:hypothetical protein